MEEQLDELMKLSRDIGEIGLQLGTIEVRLNFYIANHAINK